MISLTSNAKERVSKMKLGEIAGEVIFAGIEGPHLTERERDVLREIAPGGFVLFRKNIVTVQGARSLCDDLTSLIESAKGVRPFIAVDQEGGAVARLPLDTTQFPSAMALGASGRPMNAFKIATLIATELRTLGVNMDLAPVVDVNNNPDNPVIGTRSFWEDQNAVAQFGARFIEGLRQGRVLSVAKHFPGHGDTNVDSHDALPVIPHDMRRLESVELLPFKKAIGSGVDCIMISHVAVTCVDRRPTPSSLSKNVVSGLLRRKLSFSGLIMTDSLTMRAVSDKFEAGEASVQALEAGNDMVLASGGVRVAEEMHSAIAAKARSDKDFAKKLRRRVVRIIATKDAKLRNFRKPAPSIVGCSSHVMEIVKVVEKSVALVYDDGILPVSRRLRVASFSAVRGDEFNNIVDEELRKAFPPEQLVSHDRVVEGGQLALGKARTADVCLLFSQDLNRNPGMVDAIDRIMGLNRRTVVVAINNPYDVNEIRRPAAYIVTYSPDRFSIRVAIRSILGKLRLAGTVLPSLKRSVEAAQATGAK